MQIEWINHAGFVFSDGVIQLVCDPWLDGRPFHSSWALISPTQFSYSDFSRITHLWISHEHADHFFPPNLKKIPPELRSKIAIFFQKTRDRKVVHFLNELQFQSVIELGKTPTTVGKTEISVYKHGHYDSSLVLQTAGRTILNLNDCILSKPAAYRLKAEISAPIDVLMTSFGFASWVGNRADKSTRRKFQEECLRRCETLVKVFKPRYVIPAASFNWFCHEENFHINDGCPTVKATAERIRFLSQTIVLYPGDHWKVGDPHDSQPAIARYQSDFEKETTGEVKLSRSKTTSIEKITEAAEALHREVFRHQPARRLLPVPALCFYLTDHGKSVRLSFLRGIECSKTKRERCHVALHSETLLQALEFPSGFNSLHVTGRYEILRPSGRERFDDYKDIYSRTNHRLRARSPLRKVIKPLVINRATRFLTRFLFAT